MTVFSEAAQQAARCGPFFVVLNARSGSGDADEEIQTIRGVLEAGGRLVEFLQCNAHEPVEVMARRAVVLAKARHGVVVAAGGDGTINAVANAVMGSDCPFGVLPQGTFNYFGREHAIAQDTRKAALTLLQAHLSPVQAGRVNGRVFLVNASLGLYPQILEDREAWKSQLGRSRFVAFLSGIATLLRSRHQLRLSIESQGQTVSLRTPTLFIANNRLQLQQTGIDVQQIDALAQGQMAGIAVRPIGTLALFGLLIQGVLGRLAEAGHIQSFSFRRLTVIPKGMRRIKVATDGEIVWMQTPLIFEVAAEPLLLLVPASADLAAVE